jgi:hypothetical protein
MTEPPVTSPKVISLPKNCQDLGQVVGVAGFEPATPSSRTRWAQHHRWGSPLGLYIQCEGLKLPHFRLSYCTWLVRAVPPLLPDISEQQFEPGARIPVPNVTDIPMRRIEEAQLGEGRVAVNDGEYGNKPARARMPSREESSTVSVPEVVPD